MKLLTLFLSLFLPAITFGQLNSTFTINGGMASNMLCFGKNGSYIYISESDMYSLVDSGEYKLKGDTIILNSYVQPDDLLRVKKWKVNKSDSVYISVNFLSGSQPVFTTLIINDTLKYKLKDKELKNGLVKFKRGYIKSIKVENSYFLPWQLSKKEFHIGDDNIIELLIDDTKGFRRAFFTEEKFLNKKTYIESVIDNEYVFTLQPNIKCKY